MLVQIVIVGIILAVGGLLFSSEIHGLFPETIETVTTSLKSDVTDLGSQTANSIEQGIDHSKNVLENNIDSPINMIESSKNTLTSKITEIKPLDYNKNP